MRAEMADVEQIEKIVPLTCEIALCQHVWSLVSRVDIMDLNLLIQIDSVKQPVKSNSVVLDTCLIVGLLPLMIF